ncbi:hypothetical protein AAY473_015540 [Plecturocebus cupreus]
MLLLNSLSAAAKATITKAILQCCFISTYPLRHAGEYFAFNQEASPLPSSRPCSTSSAQENRMYSLIEANAQTENRGRHKHRKTKVERQPNPKSQLQALLGKAAPASFRGNESLILPSRLEFRSPITAHCSLNLLRCSDSPTLVSQVAETIDIYNYG